MIFWEEEFYQEGGRYYERNFGIYRTPHPDLLRFVDLLRQNQGQRVLDLGCGSGRHVIALAQEGFEVFGIDASERAIQMTQEWLNEEKLQADLKTGDIFTKLPYPGDYFNGVISTKALNHALAPHIRATIEELQRACRNGAILLIEMPEWQKKELDRTRYEKIAPCTVIACAGSEAAVPHYFFESEEELKSFFPQCNVIDVHKTGRDEHGTPGAYFTMLAEVRKKTQQDRSL